MAKLKVLVVSQFFPPSRHVAARRFGAMIPFLEQNNLELTVITSRVAGQPDIEGLPWGRIIRLGQEVNLGDTREKNATELRGPLSILRKSIQGFGFRPRIIDRFYFHWGVEAKSWLRNSRDSFDVIVGSYPPATSLWIARYAARRLGKPLVVDFRDLGALYDDHRSWVSKIFDSVVERFLLRSADILMTVSPTLQRLLSETYGKPTWLLMNTFQPIPSFRDTSVPQSYAYFAGTLYERQLPALQLFVSSFAKTGQPVRFRTRLLGPADVLRNAREIIQSEKSIVFDDLPPTSPDVVVEESQSSAFNLIFEEIEQKSRMGAGVLTGKLFQLMLSPKPILAVLRADSDVEKILQMTRKGLVASTNATLEAALDLISAKPEDFLGDPQSIQSLSPAAQTGQFAEYLHTVLRKSSI